jgi:hypothetical protein
MAKHSGAEEPIGVITPVSTFTLSKTASPLPDE